MLVRAHRQRGEEPGQALSCVTIDWRYGPSPRRALGRENARAVAAAQLHIGRDVYADMLKGKSAACDSLASCLHRRAARLPAHAPPRPRSPAGRRRAADVPSSTLGRTRPPARRRSRARVGGERTPAAHGGGFSRKARGRARPRRPPPLEVRLQAERRGRRPPTSPTSTTRAAAERAADASSASPPRTDRCERRARARAGVPSAATAGIRCCRTPAREERRDAAGRSRRSCAPRCATPRGS